MYSDLITWLSLGIISIALIILGGVFNFISKIASGKGKKLSSLFFIIGIVCLILFLIIMLVFAFTEGGNSDLQSNQSNITSQSEENVTTLNFPEFYKAYKENELLAEDTYEGNRYIVTGEINGMETGGLLNFTGGATLTMTNQIDNTIVVFYAEFEKEQEEILKTVIVGDIISFEGTCSGEGYWSDCELLQQ